MVKTKNGNGKRKNRTLARRNQTPQIGMQVANVYHFRRWIPCTTRPSVAANQTVYHLTLNVSSTNFPELAGPMAAYENYTVHSLGAKMISGVTTMNGQHAILAKTNLTANIAGFPTTPNFAYARKNGAKIVKVTNQANAVPAADSVKTMTATATNFLGQVCWIFEGPSDASNRTYLGEFQIYVDCVFHGAT